MKSTRAIPLVLMAALAACSNDTSFSARFNPTTTPPSPGLIKLVQKTHVGSQVVVDAVIFGPQPNLDLFAFDFGIAIGDDTVVRFIPHPNYPQTALVAGAGQTIGVVVDGTDPSLVEVHTAKVGGGIGNGVAGASAVVIELTFEAKKAGNSMLSFVGLGANPPRVLDSTQTPIAGVTFDTRSASIMGVSSGGSY